MQTHSLWGYLYVVRSQAGVLDRGLLGHQLLICFFSPWMVLCPLYLPITDEVENVDGGAMLS